MDDKHKLPEHSVLELKDRWKTAAGQRVRRELLLALRAGSEHWPDVLEDLPSVSNPLRPDDLDDLRGIQLAGEMLDGVSLACCDLSYSDFERSSLCNTSLQRSRLNWANLQACNLTAADLLNVEAQYANFFGCKLNEAMMMSSNFRHSILARAQLNNCVLNGSDFTGSNLNRVVFERAEFHNVIWPKTFDLASHLARAKHSRGFDAPQM